jgi:hypothetical protein
MSYTQKALAAASALLMGSSAVAAPLVLEGNYVKIGVNDAGTVGSGGATSPGILYDSTGTATFNPSYDYLTPGNPFEGFTVKGIDTDGTTVLFNYYNNNNSVGGAQITGTLVDYSGVSYRGLTFDNRAVWSGSKTEFDIEHDYRFNDNQQFVDINTRLEFKMNVPTLYFGRFTDPDARAAAGDSSSTLNVRGYAGGVPDTNIVLSEALASKYALGLFTAATNSNTGISAGWSTDPLTYYGGQDDGDGDYTIGMAFMFSGINTGDIINIQYAYIFGPSSYAAASGAVAGGAGGATSSSFTITDVGSASAPTTPSTPTVVSTNTVNNVVSSTAQSTTLPVLTVSLAEHTATEDGGVQRINRHTTTNVTTPYVTTTTTTPVTTDTYSDGSTVVTNGTPVTTTTLTNSVATSHAYDDFSGRVDQHEVLESIGGLGSGLQGLLNHEPTEPTTDKVRVFSKNYYAWSSADNGYSAKSFIYGGGLEIDIKPTWTIGAQYNNVDIDLDGVDSTSSLNKSHIGVFNMFRGNTLSLLTNAGLAQNKYNVSRTVMGIFDNASSTTGQEWWVNNRLFWHAHKNITPFVGYTVGNTRRDAFTESGSIQSARSVAAVDETSHTGEVGLNLSHRFGGKKQDLFGVSVEGSYATDNSAEVSATVDYKEMVFIQGIHQIADGVSNTAVSSNVKFRF